MKKVLGIVFFFFLIRRRIFPIECQTKALTVIENGDENISI